MTLNETALTIYTDSHRLYLSSMEFELLDILPHFAVNLYKVLNGMKEQINTSHNGS